MLLDRHDSVDLPAFLSQYWQKHPLLIKNALPGFRDFLSPEELAGLSLEDDVESRLVFANTHGWELKHGPFTERDFTFLPENNWTLLVQSVDHWLPEVKQLLQEVAFIPGWRLDDIMVSYAATGGGVGPHFDYYDVFLVQGEGSRRWQTGQRCDARTPINTESGLKILEHFEPAAEYELHCGDVLYIPAGIAHQGSALSAGLSYSIGFRAPDVSELLGVVSEFARHSVPADRRYRDPVIDPDQKPGDISSAALQQVKVLMQHALDDDDLLLQGFGRLMTEPRLQELLEAPEAAITPEQMAVQLQKGLVLQAHPVTRFACHHRGKAMYFFVNGECLYFPELNSKLAGLNDELQSALGRPLQLQKFQRNEGCLKLLTLLYNQGCLVEWTANTSEGSNEHD